MHAREHVRSPLQPINARHAEPADCSVSPQGPLDDSHLHEAIALSLWNASNASQMVSTDAC
jgi:hypothetical protein